MADFELIDDLPPAPGQPDRGQGFVDKAIAFVQALPKFGTQVNAVGAYVRDRVQDALDAGLANAAQNAITATEKAAEAVQAALQAVAAAAKAARTPILITTSSTVTVGQVHGGAMLRVIGEPDKTVTLPQQSTEPLSAGYTVVLLQEGSGRITLLTEGDDTTLGTASETYVPGNTITAVLLDDTGPNLWLLKGDAE